MRWQWATGVDGHSAVFELWNFSKRVHGRIGHQIRRRFEVGKEHKHRAGRRAVIAVHMQAHLASA